MIRTRFILGSCLAALLTLHGSLAWGQSKFINYQGRLLLGGVPANGPYSFQFELFSDPTNGIPLNTNNVDNVTVSEGLFLALLPCPPQGHFNGDPRWLEIAVRPQGGTEFTTLMPRQQITPTPYASFAYDASNAITAATARSVPWSALTGLPASFADGVDNNTTYTAGPALNLSGTTFSVAPEGITSIFICSNAVTSDKIPNGGNLAYINLPQTWTGTQTFSGPTWPFLVVSSNKVDNLNVNYLEGRNSDGFWKVGGNTSIGIPGGGCITLGSLDDTRVEFLFKGQPVMSFGDTISQETTVTLDAPVTLRGMTFDTDEGPTVKLRGLTDGPTAALDVRDGSGPGGEGGSIHLGGTGANGDRKGINFGDGDYVFMGERGADDLLELKAGRVFVNSSFFGIGLSNATHDLEIHPNGTTLADSWTTRSSRRWKTNIQLIPSALDKVQHLRGVTYDWKRNGKHDLGLIAEEVGEVIPEVVTYEANGKDAESVDYARLVAVLIEAVKEQQKQIQAQQTLMDELRSEQKRLSVVKTLDADNNTAALSKRLAALERMIEARASKH